MPSVYEFYLPVMGNAGAGCRCRQSEGYRGKRQGMRIVGGYAGRHSAGGAADISGSVTVCAAARRISNATYTEANEEFEREIAGTEKELLAITPRQSTQDAFVRFAKIHLMDVAEAWQLATPEQRGRVQNLLFDGGLAYSSKAGILNHSNSSLFSTLEAVNHPNVLLASPTGFEPVLPP